MAELSDSWHNALLQYSPRELTFVSDKLPAISGFVRWMAQYRFQDVYLAGLWKSSLVSDMCWHRAEGASKGIIPWALPLLYWAPSCKSWPPQFQWSIFSQKTDQRGPKPSTLSRIPGY